MNESMLQAKFLHLHENQLIAAAKRLQMKAAKSDLVFRMVESFNRNTVQATVTWHLHNQKGLMGTRSDDALKE